MNWADWVMRAFALFGVLVFTYQVGKHGLQWVMTEIAGWFSVAKADFLALETKFKNLEEVVTHQVEITNLILQHPALSVPHLPGTGVSGPATPAA